MRSHPPLYSLSFIYYHSCDSDITGMISVPGVERMTYRYDAELVAVVDSLPDVARRDIPAARDGMARRRDGMAFERPGSLRVSEAVTSSADGHPVELRIVAPAVRTPAVGALLFLHGGGFVLGDVEDLAGP